jgi:hypothetical protein
VHAGFQLWDGSWNPTQIINHASKENMEDYTLSAVDAELESYLLYVLAFQVR